MRTEIIDHYTMPDSSRATIRVHRSPKGVYGAKLELANGSTLPLSIGGTHSDPVRSLDGAMRGAKKFLKGVYGARNGISHLGKKGGKSEKSGKSKPLRIAYRLHLTPGEMRAVEFARGRYSWPDMLSAHASESGAVAFTEPEMWQWTDDVESDAEGGNSPFPLASGAFAEKLQGFYDERV